MIISFEQKYRAKIVTNNMHIVYCSIWKGSNIDFKIQENICIPIRNINRRISLDIHWFIRERIIFSERLGIRTNHIRGLR